MIFFKKFECFPQNRYYESSERCSTPKIRQNMWIDYNLKSRKQNLQQFVVSGIFEVWLRVGNPSPSS